MANLLRTCKRCGEQYIAAPGKPGLITECAVCGAESDMPRVHPEAVSGLVVMAEMHDDGHQAWERFGIGL